MIKSVTCFILASILGSSAIADDGRARAIQNSQRISNSYFGVEPAQWPVITMFLEKKPNQRIAPEQPVWVLNTDSNTILYYQGQPTFAGNSAAQLVDDSGIRFGVQALDNARNDQSAWLKLTLAGKKYDAYCTSRRPIVVCSLVTKL